MLLRLNSSFCYKKKKLIDYGIAVTAWNYNLNCNLNLYNVFGLQTTFLFLHSFPSVISLLYLTLDIVVALEYISVAFSQAMIGRSLFFIGFFFSFLLLVVSRPTQGRKARLHTPMNTPNQTLMPEAPAEVPLKSTEATCGHSPMTEITHLAHYWGQNDITGLHLSYTNFCLHFVAVRCISIWSVSIQISLTNYCSPLLNTASDNSGFLWQCLIFSTNLGHSKQRLAGLLAQILLLFNSFFFFF